jgi:GT2 family glycosyltransferase
VARAATGEVLVFVDDDLVPMSSDWLEELVGWALQPGIGVVGGKVIDSAGRVFHAGVSLAFVGSGSDRYLFRGCPSGEFGIFGSVEWYRDLMAVSSGCVAIRREVFDQAGAFDESLPQGDDEVSLSLAVRDRGHRVVYTPYAVLQLAGSDGTKHRAASVVNGNKLAVARPDPFYNPNLATAGGRPRIRCPSPPWT